MTTTHDDPPFFDYKRRKNSNHQIRKFLDFSHWRHPLAVTLTHKRAIPSACGLWRGTREDYRQNLRHFLNILDRRCLSNSDRRRKKHLKTVACIESDKQHRLHYHLIIDRPDRVAADEFGRLIEQVWPVTRWGHHQVDVREAYSGGWLPYITKNEFSGDCEAIDWDNTNR